MFISKLASVCVCVCEVSLWPRAVMECRATELFGKVANNLLRVRSSCRCCTEVIWLRVVILYFSSVVCAHTRVRVCAIKLHVDRKLNCVCVKYHYIQDLAIPKLKHGRL